MHKLQHRNLNMKNQGSVSPPNAHNNTTAESKDNKLAEMSEIIQKTTDKNGQ
jgi:hypothetical protein